MMTKYFCCLCLQLSVSLLSSLCLANPLNIGSIIKPPWLPLIYANPGLYPNVPTKKATIRDPARGIIRDVSYRVGANGLAIIDGDLVFGTEQQLLAAVVRKKKRGEIDQAASSSQLEERAFSVDIAMPNGIIPYYFQTVADQTAQQKNVNTAVARWKVVAPYLNFQDRGVWNGVGFGIMITSNDVGCYCNDIAMRKYFGPWNMNLNATYCGPDEAVHEFGHALGKDRIPSRRRLTSETNVNPGLIHEHKRPDRGTKFNFQCANLNPQCPTGVAMAPGTNCCNNIVSGCCSKLYDFQVQPASTTDDYQSAYDVQSVMQYVGAAFALPGLLTLTAVNPADNALFDNYTNPSQPSAGDSTRVCRIYRDRCPKAIDCVNRGCASKCTAVTPCYSSKSCGFDTPPACCDPGAI